MNGYSALDPWQERLRRVLAEQKLIQDEERAARLAAAPPAPPAEPGLWNNMTGQERMVRATLARDYQMADERRPRPAPAPEPQSQYIDATYAEALGKRLRGANTEAERGSRLKGRIAQ